MRDILFATLGVALFALFCGILVVFVQRDMTEGIDHPALVVTVLIVLAMTAWDFIRELFIKRKDD